MNPLRRAASLVPIALFLTGAAGLVDEIVWIRRASLVLGSTVHAVSAVVSVFLLGLALGGWVFGRRSRRDPRPLATCATLGLALAIATALTIPALERLDPISGRLWRALPPDSPALWLARAALVAVVILPPTILMGGSLPLACRALVAGGRPVGRVIATLYGVNTLGATMGCLLEGLLLLPAIGMRASLGLAAALEAVAAALFLAASRRQEALVADDVESPRAERPPLVRIAALVFVAGFVALGEEVLWTRFLALVLRNTVTTYTLTLAVVLLGIVLGSLAVATLPERGVPRARLFGTLQLASGLLVAWTLHLPPSLWSGLSGELPAIALLLLPASVLAGASFPLALRLGVDRPEAAGHGVGRLTAFNTLGAIAGAVAVGFFTLPHAGLAASARLCTAASLAVGVAAWLLLDRGRVGAKMAVAAVVVAAWALAPAIPGTKLPADFLARASTLVDFREGLEANVAVVQPSPGRLELEIDRWWQGRNERTHQVMAAHLPMLLHRDPRRVLVVGVGAGQTPMRFAMYPLERLDCVDIEPRVFELVRARFPSAWMDDPRVHLLRADGRDVLAHDDATWDIVSLEVGQVFRPGVASFYTLDFYRRAAARLRPDGLLVQFVPIAFLPNEEIRSVIATFLAAFPRATLWYNTSELLLVGANDGPPRLTPERVATVTGIPAVAEDLRFSHWGGPAEWFDRPGVLLGGFLCGPRGLATLAQGAVVQRDDRPALEYAASRITRRAGRERDAVPLLRRHVDPVAEGAARAKAFSASVVAEADRIREENLRDMVAATWLRDVEDARAEGDLARVLDAATRARDAHPRNVEAQRFLGDALLLSGRFVDADSAYRAALAVAPADPRVHAGLGFALHRRGLLAPAIAEYRAAVDGGFEDAELRNNLGAALGQSGDLAGAAREFERALALSPGDASVRRNLEQTRAAMEASKR